MSSGECLERIAEVLEAMQEGLDKVLEETPSEYRERVSHIIVETMQKRFAPEDTMIVRLDS